MRFIALAVLGLSVGFTATGAEEKIRGVLEKTAKAEACAQIADALNDIYYISKTDAAEKMVAPFVGKNQKVVVTGTVENKPNEMNGFVSVKSVEAYAPKLPPAPPPPPVEKKDEKKEDKKDEKKEDKKDERK